MQCIIRENTGGFLRPFHKTNITRVQTILNTRIQGFIFIFNTVQVHMINGLAALPHGPGQCALCFLCFVLVDDGERRACDHILHAHYFAQRMYKSGFSCTHFTMKSKYFITGCPCQQHGCRFPYLVKCKIYLHVAKIFSFISNQVTISKNNFALWKKLNGK